MVKKNLKSMIDNIEEKEEITSRLEEKVETLTVLVDKQKKIINQQTAIIDQQKEKLSKMVDVPDDIRELREVIGTQRAEINEKESELEHTKGLLVQAQKELELTLNRMNPTQIKVEAALDTIGKLKEELAQKNSELMIKNETIKTLTNKYNEAEITAKSLLKRLEGIEEGVSKKDLEELKVKHSEERKKLKSEITKLESQLLDQKLEYDEKITEAKDMAERYEDLVKKLEDFQQKNNQANEKIKSLEASQVDLKEYKKNTFPKLKTLEKLRVVMEEDPLFRAYFIIEEVGHISLDDLRAAVGSPIVVVKKDVEKLQKLDLVEMNDVGKISIKKIEAE
ncbi:MAG: hypothetical protein EU539_03305 [Promethearchaeota archaeon]|nr:MAG: hypothetical protein EU539_03305 [Candidatus Lokiarchaeota archaeon]